MRVGSLVLNKNASFAAFCCDASHTSWIDISVVSVALIPTMIEWVVLEDVKFLQSAIDNYLTLSSYPTRNTISTTGDCSLVNWHVSHQYLLLVLDI